MMEGAGRPRLEDFGITEEDLERTPCAFLTQHRVMVLVALYLMIAVGVFAIIVRTGGSFSAALYFTVISLAAGSVLLLPALVLALCASERAEERWLCARFPKMRACLEYRRAVADHAQRPVSTSQMPAEAWWRTASQVAFLAAVRRELEERLGFEVSNLDREATGADMVVRTAAAETLVRCESGSEPVAAAVGRELMAAMADRGAARAVVVSAAEPAPALDAYVGDRPLALVRPWELERALRR